MTLFRILRRFSAALAAAIAFVQPALAGEVRVAVAANFTEAAREIGAYFEETTGHTVIFSFASTGQLFAQISLGAPFEVFLAADQKTAKRAVDEGLAEAGSRFTYATGRLVMVSKEMDLADGGSVLAGGAFTRIAIANPDLAPYGAAAIETMQALGVHDALKDRIVQGTTVTQVYQFALTGNAEIGFVALSQVVNKDELTGWTVPANLHTPIAQDAVLLVNGADNEAARAFIEVMKSAEAGRIKQRFGYE